MRANRIYITLVQQVGYVNIDPCCTYLLGVALVSESLVGVLGDLGSKGINPILSPLSSHDWSPLFIAIINGITLRSTCNHYVCYNYTIFHFYCNHESSNTTSHVFVKHRCPLYNKVKTWQNLQVLHFDPAQPTGACDISEV